MPEHGLPNKCPTCGSTEEWVLHVGNKQYSEAQFFEPPAAAQEPWLPTRIVVCAKCGAAYAKTGKHQAPTATVLKPQPSGGDA